MTMLVSWKSYVYYRYASRSRLAPHTVLYTNIVGFLRQAPNTNLYFTICVA